MKSEVLDSVHLASKAAAAAAAAEDTEIKSDVVLL
jgi:hypothetical protein